MANRRQWERKRHQPGKQLRCNVFEGVDVQTGWCYTGALQKIVQTTVQGKKTSHSGYPVGEDDDTPVTLPSAAIFGRKGLREDSR